MAKINRPDVNVQGFASQPQSQERTTFGTEVESSNLADYLNSDFLRGWGSLPVGQNPPYQWFNGALYLVSQLQAYQFQQGIPEYAATQEYHEDSFAKFGGNLYRSLIDNNTGNQPDTSPSDWEPFGASSATLSTPGVLKLADATLKPSGSAETLEVNRSYMLTGTTTRTLPADSGISTDDVVVLNKALSSIPVVSVEGTGGEQIEVKNQDGTTQKVSSFDYDIDAQICLRFNGVDWEVTL